MRKNNKPHIGVYARLKPSNVHGVGVFAIRDIPKGANIFSNDTSQMRWILKKQFLDVKPEIRRLYDDFCVIKGNKYGCPENFNSLTVAWYINEPPKGKSPNVKCDKDYNFIASRKIKEGEELFVNYSDYSDLPQEEL